ncbi:MAG: insulinase family protein [Rhizobiales bacterium]|nr:insulinase family protein [Hyphomicrobiales bacterium]NRB13545.1 insulinase family protein [Hyphomicrobiales bacterium]
MKIEKKKNGISCFSLANGLDVVVIEDHRAPVITHMLWYKVGAADEVAGKSGIAHFLEHLMFKGTDKIAPGEHSKIIAKNGGQDNAFTGQDYTCYFERLAADRLELAMELEADRMTGLTLSDEVLLPERDVVREERKQRTDNKPDAIHFEQMTAALFLAHPYGVPIIGWDHEIAELNRHDAIKFYKQHYAPDNAILVVAGDVTPEQVLKLAQKHYGSIKSQNITPRKRVIEPPHMCARQVDMFDERVEQPQWIRQYLAPSARVANAEKDKQAEALQLGILLLAGSTTSHLYVDLVVNQQAAVAAGGWYNSVAMDYAPLGLYAIPREPFGLSHMAELIDVSVANFLEKGPSDSAFERAKNLMVAESLYTRDNQTSMARMIGAALCCNMTLEDILDWPERIESLTKADILDALSQYIDEKSSVTGHLWGKDEHLLGIGETVAEADVNNAD